MVHLYAVSQSNWFLPGAQELTCLHHIVLPPCRPRSGLLCPSYRAFCILPGNSEWSWNPVDDQDVFLKPGLAGGHTAKPLPTTTRSYTSALVPVRLLTTSLTKDMVKLIKTIWLLGGWQILRRACFLVQKKERGQDWTWTGLELTCLHLVFIPPLPLQGYVHDPSKPTHPGKPSAASPQATTNNI